MPKTYASSATGSGGSGTIGGTIADTQVAFGTAADTIGGEAAFTYNSTTNVLTVLSGAVLTGHSAIGIGSSIDKQVFGGGTTVASVLTTWESPTTTSNSYFYGNLGFLELNPAGSSATRFHGTTGYAFIPTTNAQNFTNYIAGVQGYADMEGSGTVTQGMGFRSEVYVGTTQHAASIYGLYAYVNIDGTVDEDAFGVYVGQPIGAGTVTGSTYGVWIDDQTRTGGATDYGIWYNGGPGGDASGAGVWRINQKGIVAYYNPSFAAYVPDAVNFERIITRWGFTTEYGTDNIAYIGVEKGGTGTNRVLNLVGSAIGVMSVPGTYTSLTSAGLLASANDVGAIGAAGTAFSDLFLAEGGVINWDSGDATLTQVGDVLTLAGADLKVTTPGNAATSVLTTDGTQTLTNKRITKRVTTAADATSITPNTDTADVTYQANTQAAGTLTINADGGTPTNGQSWMLKIKSTNVQTFAWNAIFAGGTIALPTVTTGGTKIDYFVFVYDTVTPKWHYTGTALGF